MRESAREYVNGIGGRKEGRKEGLVWLWCKVFGTDDALRLAVVAVVVAAAGLCCVVVVVVVIVVVVGVALYVCDPDSINVKHSLLLQLRAEHYC